MTNLLNTVKYKYIKDMINDGFTLTRERNDQLTKWVLENKNRNIRLFYYEQGWDYDIRMSKAPIILLKKLSVQDEIKNYGLPYSVFTSSLAVSSESRKGQGKCYAPSYGVMR